MEKLIVDAEGKITIPPHILEKRGLRPGDELALLEAAEGLLVYQAGLDSKTFEWWNNLNNEDRQQAREEALRYETMSAEERDRLWEAEAESIEPDAEADELDSPAKQRAL